MRQYGLSEQKVRSVLRKPFRVEEGIVKNTIAVMIPASAKASAGKPAFSQFSTGDPSEQLDKPNWKGEIWVMYQLRKIKKQKKIISAWRYPGVSPKNNPIPEDILREVLNIN